MESCSETKIFIVIEGINVTLDDELATMIELMEEWMKRLVGI